jgi:hypothetical protein
MGRRRAVGVPAASHTTGLSAAGGGPALAPAEACAAGSALDKRRARGDNAAAHLTGGDLMHRMPRSIASGLCSARGWLPVLIAALAVAAAARADVQVTQKSTSEGLGGFGDGTTTSSLVVAGDRSRSDEEFTYTGRFKTLVGKKPRKSAHITRLDRELMWNLEPDKQRYTELTFAEMREQMAKAEAQMEQQSAAGAEAKPQDENMTFTLDVKKTGARQDIAGFSCEQAIITCTGKPKEPKKGEENTEVRLVFDQWLSKQVPGAAEMNAFGRKFAEKLGLDSSMSSMSGMARAMYGNAMKEMAKKLKDVEGYPLKSTFTIEGQGPPAQQQPAEAGEKANAEQAKSEDAGSGAEDVTSGGGVTGKLGGFLGKRLAKAASKKAESAAAPKKGSEGAPSQLFKVVSEVISVSSSPAAAGSFEVPAGYKKEKLESH